MLRSLVRAPSLARASSLGASLEGSRLFSVQVNEKLKNVRESATLKINMKVRTMRQADPNVTISHFGFGQSPFPVPEPVQQALRDHASEKDYLPTRGLPRLCDAIAAYYQKYYELSHFHTENVFVGPGSKELLYHLLYLMEGDLFLPAPSWVSYGPQAQLIGKHIRPVHTTLEEEYRITPESLEEACSASYKGQKILILNSPNNPTGAVYPQQQLQEIAQVCAANDVLVISDEIYAGVNFSTSHEHTSLAKFYPEGTIVTGGLSKLFAAGGYRFGCALIPTEGFEQVHEGLKVIISETYSCVSAPIQYAALSAYEDFETILPYLETCNKVHEISSLYLHDRFEAMGLACPQPGGAFYLFPNFDPYEEQLKSRGVTNSEELANFLLEEAQVAALPAGDFNLPSGHLSLRVAGVDYNGGAVVDHLQNGGKFTLSEEDVTQWMPSLRYGCDRLEKLLKSL